MERAVYLVSSEVKEEICDILYILNKKDISKSDILLYIPKYIHLEDIDLSSYKITFYKKSTNIKVLNKIIELAKFFFVVFKYKPDVIFSGSSMFKHKISSSLFGIKHIAYFRGLMFSSSNKIGIMDKLKFGKYGYFFKSKIFNRFESDLIITTSELNKNFIIERGIPEKKIQLINPLWLSGLALKQTTDKKIYFLTQAFHSHGFSLQHDSQIKFLSLLDEWSAEHGKPLTVRVHPRDYFDYKNLKYKSNISFDSRNPKEFMKDLSYSEIVISPLSTLAFEVIYLGGCCCFYTTEALDYVYASAYRKLSIDPIKETEINKLNDLNCQKKTYKDVFFHGDEWDSIWV